MRTAGALDPPAGSGAADRPALRTAEAVVNAASGSVGPGAAADLEAMLRGAGLEARVQEVEPHGIEAATRSAVERRPDLLVVLAGDGTAALAASLSGAEGPLIAPLPGGTMNLLPHALYGATPWREALARALGEGVARPVSGGEVDGRAFYVAAILGLPALWADAREELRSRRFAGALARARIALQHTFRRSLRYTIEGSPTEKTEALMLLCPLVSRALYEEGALEAAALDPSDAAQAVRLGFNAATGRWREDPSVVTVACRAGRAWTSRDLPAVLDGEPCRLSPFVEFRYLDVAFRALAPPIEPPALSADEGEPLPPLARSA